ncbi:MAG: CBS domain-containing protein [bacterium]
METLKDILDEKGRNVWSVRPDDSVIRALGVLSEANVGALMVITDAGKLVGVFSERDFARQALLHRGEVFELPVKEMMSTRVRTAPSTLDIDACMSLMTTERIRHLPVVEEGRLAGVISIGDVVKATAGEKDTVIEQLEHYISSSL